MLAGEEDRLAIHGVHVGIGGRIDGLARAVNGRMRICHDFDRQKIVPFGTSREIHDLIEEEVRKLKSPEGDLEFIAGIAPPAPLENLDALCRAIEKFRTWWWD